MATISSGQANVFLNHSMVLAYKVAKALKTEIDEVFMIEE